MILSNAVVLIACSETRSRDEIVSAVLVRKFYRRGLQVGEPMLGRICSRDSAVCIFKSQTAQHYPPIGSSRNLSTKTKSLFHLPELIIRAVLAPNWLQCGMHTSNPGKLGKWAATMRKGILRRLCNAAIIGYINLDHLRPEKTDRLQPSISIPSPSILKQFLVPSHRTACATPDALSWPLHNSAFLKGPIPQTRLAFYITIESSSPPDLFS